MTNSTDLMHFLGERIREVRSNRANYSLFEIRDGIPGSYGIAGHIDADCDAKERIVALSWTTIDEAERHGGRDDPISQVYDLRANQAWGTLRALALAYSWHPDYREEWRP